MSKTRMTRQKRIVLAVVRASRSHPTAREVLAEARKILPSISQATVYRNLEQLAEAGMIRKIVLTDQVARYDNNIGRHYHIRCRACGRVDDLPLSFSRSLEEKIAASVGYLVLDHQLEVRGLCPVCREAVDESSKSNESHSQ